MNKPNGSGLSRIVKAGQCSIQGLKAVFKHEAAFRQELLAAAVLLPVAYIIGRTPLGVSLMIFGLGLVLLVEVLNSAIEAIVDRIGLEQHELSGRAKDLGSLAVLIAILLCAVIWIGVYLSGV
ncbi:MAG: diacylglycerol kinase [Desulfobacterales bacterium]|nr:diacylglycerol kinase [Desulfobacterales bacterium]